MSRTLFSSGSSRAPHIGFNRAVRHCWHDFGLNRRCPEIDLATLVDLGSTRKNVIRSRVMLTHITRWKDVAFAHGQVFGAIKAACTFVKVTGFFNPEWLVETELGAIVSEDTK
ncbi:MAG: hypothetical protein MK098_03305 [Marinovum sp.]|nr:hypothetical protein [Marinovum sp.]